MRTQQEEHTLSGSCGIICTFPLGERLVCTAAQNCQCSWWVHSLSQELVVYLEILWVLMYRYVPMCESVRDTETGIPEMSLRMESFISPFIDN